MTTQPISAAELRDRLKQERMVEVKGMAFLIRKVSLLLLADDPARIWEWARAGEDVLKEKIKELLKNPTTPMMQRVILKGVLEPRITEAGGDANAVAIDLVLASHELSAGLFIEIVNLSLGG